MYNHAAPDYQCPMCLAIEGIENDHTWIKQADIFYRDELVLGFIGSKFIDSNPGYPLLVPVTHYENIYNLPSEVGHRIADLAQRTALALKEVRECNGIKLVQNNEPAAGQHAFHYHLHIIPRFEGDDFNANSLHTRVSAPEERIPYAETLRQYFDRH